MFRFVIVQDVRGYFSWRLEGPASRGVPTVLVSAPQYWPTKQMAVDHAVRVKSQMLTATIVDNSATREP